MLKELEGKQISLAIRLTKNNLMNKNSAFFASEVVEGDEAADASYPTKANVENMHDLSCLDVIILHFDS